MSDGPSDAEIEERYRKIVAVFGLVRPPRLVLTNRVVQNHVQLAGSYAHKGNCVTLVRSAVNDSLIAHELVHHLCATEMNYYGYHGVPFLALLQLVRWTYFDESRDADQVDEMVATTWSSLWSSRSMRQTAVAEARLLARNAAEYMERRPCAYETARDMALLLIRLHPSVQLERSWLSRAWWVDEFSTQKGNAYRVIGIGIVVLVLGSVFGFSHLPSAAAPLGLRWIMVSFGLLFAWVFVVPPLIRAHGWATRVVNQLRLRR